MEWKNESILHFLIIYIVFKFLQFAICVYLYAIEIYFINIKKNIIYFHILKSL